MCVCVCVCVCVCASTDTVVLYPSHKTHTHICVCVCLCVDTRAKQSWPSLIHRLWKQICLNVFIVSREEGNRERDAPLYNRELYLPRRMGLGEGVQTHLWLLSILCTLAAQVAVAQTPRSAVGGEQRRCRVLEHV